MSEFPESSAPGLGSPVATSPTEVPQLQGVGGWLLFFCISVTIIGPILALASLVSGYAETAPYYDQMPVLRIIMIVDFALSLGLAAFGVYAGIGLWRIRPGAVRVAKVYLACCVLYQLATIAILLAGMPSETHEAMAPDMVKDLARSLVFFGIWYSYLNKSVRVKNTYGV